MSHIIIRRVKAEDEPEWLRMRLALWPDNTPEELMREMDEVSVDEMTPVFVTERPGGGLGGFLEGGTRLYAEGCSTRPVGYIEGWFVDEDLRCKGVGAQLVRAIEDWARARG
jgi:aminoglycoside 6'-N-acetyltransferase I